MKTTINKYMTFAILLLLTVGLGGCGDSSEEKISSEECECGEQFIKNVEGSGTVSYNETVGKWQISSHVQGTYDTVYLYLVSGNKNLDDIITSWLISLEKCTAFNLRRCLLSQQGLSVFVYCWKQLISSHETTAIPLWRICYPPVLNIRIYNPILSPLGLPMYISCV